MEIQKTAIQVGNSAGVLLPKSWEGKNVVVTLQEVSEKEITKDIIEILIDENLLRGALGIYLIGSKARGESGKESDIDILVITKETNKTINQGVYSLVLIDYLSLERSLKENLIYHYPMVLEARPLINSQLIEHYRPIQITKKNALAFLDSTKKMLKVNLDAVKYTEKLGKNQANGAIRYSLMLRLRGIYILENILKKKTWKKEELIKIVRKVTGSLNIYKAYLKLKQNKKSFENVPLEDARKMIDYIEHKVKELEKWAAENL